MSLGANQEESLLNQSTISFQIGSGSYTAYSNTVETPIVGPVMTLQKTTGAVQVVPGIPVTYSVTIGNEGNVSASVTIFEEASAGMVFVPNSVQRNGIPIPGADPVTGIPLGNLGVGDSVLITFQLILLASSETLPTEVSDRMRADYFFVTSTGRIVTGSSFSNTVTLPVSTTGKPVIYATLSVNKGKAVPGDILKYTLTVNNVGNLAGEVVLVSYLPPGTLFVPNSITVNGQILSGIVVPVPISLGSIQAGGRVIVTFEARVPGTNAVTPGQVFSDSALLRTTYTQGGGTYTDETESNAVDVTLFYPVISAEVEASPKVTHPDGRVEFSLTVRNSGNSPARLTTSRLVPSSLIVVPGSIRVGGVPIPGPAPDGSVDFGELAPGGIMIITFRTVVSPMALSNTIRSSIVIQYDYELNGVLYIGTVSTNPYLLIVEHGVE